MEATSVEQKTVKGKEVTFAGKTYVFPELDADALFQAVIDRLKVLRLSPMDVVIERYDELKDRPLLLDRLLDRALRAKVPPPPTKEEVFQYMTSFDGQVWTVWWTLSKSYPELTLLMVQEMLIHEGTAMATKDMAGRA